MPYTNTAANILCIAANSIPTSRSITYRIYLYFKCMTFKDLVQNVKCIQGINCTRIRFIASDKVHMVFLCPQRCPCLLKEEHRSPTFFRSRSRWSRTGQSQCYQFLHNTANPETTWHWVSKPLRVPPCSSQSTLSARSMWPSSSHEMVRWLYHISFSILSVINVWKVYMSIIGILQC